MSNCTRHKQQETTEPYIYIYKYVGPDRGRLLSDLLPDFQSKEYKLTHNIEPTYIN